MGMSNEANKNEAGPTTAGAGVGTANGNGKDAGAAAEVVTEAAAEVVATPIPSVAEIETLREKASQADSFKDRYLRSVADLENFRKRAARERQEAVQYANQRLMEKLIPVLDNLDMALVAVSSAQGGNGDALKTGVEMVLGQARGVLKEAGLEEVSAVGQVFDPTWHEAVSQQETNDVPEGQVIQQLRKGYKLQERLLRPASVIVARKPQA